MDKRRLREQLKIRRSSLSPADVEALSHQVINRLWDIVDWNNVYSVHTYLPIKTSNEIDTTPLIRAAWQLRPDIKFASTDPVSLETKWLDNQMKPAKQVPDNFQYGLMVVPMLGFDASGNRLGWGSAFYDNFLATQTQAFVVGLCYEYGHLPKIPRESHDVPLNFIVTEKTVYKF